MTPPSRITAPPPRASRREEFKYVYTVEPEQGEIERNIRAIAVAVATLCLPLCLPWASSHAADPAAVARGKYLVTIASCHDCHTPGFFLGKPDMARYLGGSDVGFELPGLGVFHGPNLTPDKATGRGGWTDPQVVAAIQKGARPDGRLLAPIMPYHAFATLTKQDVEAIVAFLRSIPPVQNKGGGPLRSDRDADILRDQGRAAGREVVGFWKVGRSHLEPALPYDGRGKFICSSPTLERTS